MSQEKPTRDNHLRTLDSLDGAALDALLEARAAGQDQGPMPPGGRDRSEQLHNLVALLAADDPAAEPFPDELRERTMRAVRDARHRSRFNQQIDELSRPAAGFSMGTSWRQVLVAGLVLLVGGSLLLPILEENRAAANRLLCRDNLAAAGLAFNAYATDHDGHLPATPVAAGSNWGKAGVASASNSSNLFRMIRGGYLKPVQLACPENDHFDIASQADASASDWAKPELVSYSYQNQFGGQATRIDAFPQLALLADRNPLFKQTPQGLRFDSTVPEDTSATMHRTPGQNVLQADGTASWWSSPVLQTDAVEDNIWTAQGVSSYLGVETPQSDHDSFLLP
ncbi:MAG: hypothetical protein RLN76_07825 [Phycisphaeraceae bacterium]